MIDMLETGLVLNMRRNDGMGSTARREVFRSRGCLVFILIIRVTLAGEIFRTFMFMRWAELRNRDALTRKTCRYRRRTRNTHIDIDPKFHAYHTTKTHTASCCDRR